MSRDDEDWGVGSSTQGGACLECGAEVYEGDYCSTCEDADEEPEDNEEPQQHLETLSEEESEEPAPEEYEMAEPNDVEDYCDDCTGLLDEEDRCTNNHCPSAPCLTCGGDRSACPCAEVNPVETMELSWKRDRDRLHEDMTAVLEERLDRLTGNVDDTMDRFESPEHFARHLARRHGMNTTGEGDLSGGRRPVDTSRSQGSYTGEFLARYLAGVEAETKRIKGAA